VSIEGLTNAPTTFQTVMYSISIHPYIRKCFVVYIDAIVIFSNTKAEHQAHVRLLLEMLKQKILTSVKQDLASLRRRSSIWDIL
jgi:hypothetical protein